MRSTWSAGERSEGEAPKAGADPFPRAARERSVPQMVRVSRLLVTQDVPEVRTRLSAGASRIL